MKQLLAGVVILFVVGFGSFLYRNTMERPGVAAPEVACTMEAKVCPDGSSVGRTGPRCEFASCAYPNVEIAEAGVSFVVPEGYTADENAYGADPNLLAAFVKPSLSGNPQHTIVVRRYPISNGQSAEEVIRTNTRFQPADEQAADLSRFNDFSINGKVFKDVVIERFEALVHSRYYYVRTNDVLSFEITEHDVMDWMEPTLAIRALPEHAAFLGILRTLEATP